jgi:predicted MFS family arabinose efflux permease
VSRHRWIALAVLTLARTAMGLQFQSVGAVSPLLMERLGIDNAELGVLIGLFSLPGVALALPGGMLGQRLGERRLVLAALLLMTLGSALIGQATTFPGAVAGRCLTAIGAVLLNVLGTVMVADWFSGREIIWALAIFLNAWPVGNALALFALPAIAGLWTVAAAFHAGAGAAAIGAAAMALVYPRPVTGDGRRDAPAPSGLSRREVGLVTLAAMPWMLYNVGYAVMLGFAPALLVRGGLSVAHAGALLGVALVLLVGSVQVGGAAARWLARPERIAVLGLLPFGVALALLPWGSARVALVVIGLLAGLPAAALVAAPTAVLRKESRASGMGLFYTWYYAGMALLPVAAGWVQDAVGGAAAIEFAAAAVFMALVSHLAFRAVARPG